MMNSAQFASGLNKNAFQSVGSGTNPLAGMPNIGAKSGGIDPMMIMAMMSGMGGQGQQPAGPQVINGADQYQPPQFMPGQFDTQKMPYSESVLRALRGGI